MRVGRWWGRQPPRRGGTPSRRAASPSSRPRDNDARRCPGSLTLLTPHLERGPPGPHHESMSGPGGPRSGYVCVIAAEIFSAVISFGKFVLAQGPTGKTEASTRRRPCTPRTRPSAPPPPLGPSRRPLRRGDEAG